MSALKDLNLMPRDVIVRKNYQKLLRLTIAAVGIILAISLILDLGVFIYKTSYTKKVKGQLATIDNKIGAQTDYNIQNVIKEKIDYKNKVYEKLKDASFNTGEILNSIEKIIPKDVSIVILNIEPDGKVSLQGQADTENSVLDFFYNIKNSDLTDYVKFEGLNGKFGDEKGFEFIFEFNIKNVGSDIIEIE